MSLSVDDLFTPITAEEFRINMVTNLVALGIPADKWRAGGVASTIITVAAMSLAMLSGVIVTLIRGFFLPTATGNSLRVLAKYVFDVTVPDASFATGTVTLTNAGGATYTFAAGEYTCQNATTKTTYTNDAAFVVAPGPGTTVSVSVIATTPGSAGNAAPGAINTNVTTLISVTVTNALSLVGLDSPNDATIRTLCTNKLGALSVRGVRTAYAYAVQTAVNSVTGAPVNINRWSVSSASHTCEVDVVVASPTGAPDTNDVTGIATNIEAIARPEGITVNLSPATTVAFTPAVTVTTLLPTGVTSATAKTAIDAAIATFISTYPIGGESANDDANPSVAITALFASGLYGVIAEAIAALGGKMIACKGATDLVLTPLQVATDGVTTTIRVIAPTSGTTVV